MVQLNTTYDSKIKEKIFILKGDEGYARTTDVIANLITDFDDYDTHISSCHVGVEIQVLRELGESTIDIYINDEVKTIPWSYDNMDEIIDSTWNENGVYWENGKLIIGKYETSPELIETGLYLPYDVEHTIRVRYNGNKYCLGSSSKPIVFTVPTPNAFRSMLTLSSESPRYAPNTEIDDLSLLFQCENQIEEPKTVKIYDDDTLLATATVEKDVPTTVNVGVLSDGLHTLKAVFDGDDEAFGSTTQYYVSVGYNIGNLEYPSSVINGATGTLSCKVTDYFNEPLIGYGICVSEYTDGEGWSEISQTVESDSDGLVTIDPVYFTNKPFAVTIGSSYMDTHTTNVISPTSLSMNLGSQYVVPSSSTTITGAVYSNGSIIPVEGIGITFISTDVDGKEYEWNAVTGSDGKYSTTIQTDANGKVEIVGWVDNSLVNNRVYLDVLRYWWDRDDNKQYGYAQSNNVSTINTNRGYKFENLTETDGTVVFNYYGGGKWVTEFDLVDIKDGAYNYLKFNGRDIFETEHLVGTPSHWRIEHDADNTVRWYVDNVLWQTYIYTTRAFVIGLNYDSIIIDNLMIERTE